MKSIFGAGPRAHGRLLRGPPNRRAAGESSRKRGAYFVGQSVAAVRRGLAIVLARSHSSPSHYLNLATGACFTVDTRRSPEVCQQREQSTGNQFAIVVTGRPPARSSSECTCLVANCTHPPAICRIKWLLDTLRPFDQQQPTVWHPSPKSPSRKTHANFCSKSSDEDSKSFVGTAGRHRSPPSVREPSSTE